MLKLRIENFDQLPDGGPIEFSVDRRGFDFGREQHLDWTLPDQSGVISRKHCEVRFFEQSYWLFDLSTNGTFVNKSPKRVQSPYKLMDGDELRIGDYVISVFIPASQPARQQIFDPTPLAASPRDAGIWESASEAPPPIDPRELMPPAPEIRRAPDYLHQVVHLPPVVETPPRPPAADIWGAPSTPASAAPVPTQPAVPPVELPFQPSAPMYTSQPAVSAPQSSPERSPASTSSGSSAALMARLATGAGLPADFFQGRDPNQVAEEIGALLNSISGHLMQLLNARAAAKTLSRSGKRTLIQARDNNPLKFMPGPEDALRIMLGPPTASYLTAGQTIDSSFADLKQHQLATLAAMQQAASQVFDELSPDAIKKVADGAKKSLLSSGKGKYWDMYVETWAARSGGKEHGMLTAFLDAFAQVYDQETKTKQ